MMMYFKNDQGTYRGLATEIDTNKPNLTKISMIGHDMDQAIENGLTILVNIMLLVSSSLLATCE